jgi:predicted nucleic acid-binding Zn finger protein
MLLSKDINKICELKNGFTQMWLEPEFILSSLKSFSFSDLCKCIDPVKMRGYSFQAIFTILISLPFIGAASVNSMVNGVIKHNVEAGKDTFYRIKNNSGICWRMILWLFATKFKKLTESEEEETKAIKCMIFDDTVIAKTGRCIEKISRVWDHVSNSYMLAFKMLLMGYWDGVSFIPLDFSYHREKGKNKEKLFGLKKKELEKQHKKKREAGSFNYERAAEADMSKIDCAIKMFLRAISQGFKIDYVLVDSWFTCSAFIDAVVSVKKQVVHFIGMYKIPKTKFRYSEEMYTHSQIRNMLGKAKRCRKLGFYYKEATVFYGDKKLKLFFSKQGKNGKWKVFICTDTSLSFIKMIEIYQIRWSIEVFFRETKQLLRLGRCQSNDFDAQIADATITMVQYILLTCRFRYENYESKTGMFLQIKEETTLQRLNQRLWGLFLEVVRVISEIFEDIDHMQLFEKIIQNEETYTKIKRLLGRDENIKMVA